MSIMSHLYACSLSLAVIAITIFITSRKPSAVVLLFTPEFAFALSRFYMKCVIFLDNSCADVLYVCDVTLVLDQIFVCVCDLNSPVLVLRFYFLFGRLQTRRSATSLVR